MRAPFASPAAVLGGGAWAVGGALVVAAGLRGGRPVAVAAALVALGACALVGGLRAMVDGAVLAGVDGAPADDGSANGADDVAVAVVCLDDDVMRARVAVLAARDSVGRDRVVLVGAAPWVERLAEDLQVLHAGSDGTWADGARVAMAVSPAGLLALTSSVTVLSPWAVRSFARVADGGEAWVQSLPALTEPGLAGVATAGRVLDGWGAWPVPGEGSVVRLAALREAADVGIERAAARALRAGWRGRATSEVLVVRQRDVATGVQVRRHVSVRTGRLRALAGPSSPLWHRTRHARPWCVRLAVLRQVLDDLAGAVAAVALAAAGVLVALGAFGSIPRVAVAVALPGALAAGAGRWWATGGALGAGRGAWTSVAAIDVSLRAVGGLVRRRPRRMRACAFPQALTTLVTVALLAAEAGRAVAFVLGRFARPGAPMTDLPGLAAGAAALVPLAFTLRIVSRRPLRRSGERVRHDGAVTVGAAAARLVDVSAAGLALHVPDVFSVPPLRVPVEVVVPDGLQGPIRLEAIAVRTAAHRGGLLVGLEVLDRAGADELRRWWATLATREIEAIERGVVRAPVRWAIGGDRRLRVACAATALVLVALVMPPYAIATALAAFGR